MSLNLGHLVYFELMIIIDSALFFFFTALFYYITSLTSAIMRILIVISGKGNWNTDFANANFIFNYLYVTKKCNC